MWDWHIMVSSSNMSGPSPSTTSGDFFTLRTEPNALSHNPYYFNAGARANPDFNTNSVHRVAVLNTRNTGVILSEVAVAGFSKYYMLFHTFDLIIFFILFY